MGHGILRIDRIPVHRFIFKVDARRYHQPVIANFGTRPQLYCLCGTIDADRPVMDDVDAVPGCQCIIGMADIVIVMQAAQIEVGEEAGIILLCRFNQGYIDGSLRVLGDVARGSRPAGASSDNHHTRFRALRIGWKTQASGQGT